MTTYRNWGLLTGLGDVLLTSPSAGSVPLYSATLGGFGDSSRGWDCGAATTTGMVLVNTTASTVGTPQQWSPGITFGGKAYPSSVDTAYYMREYLACVDSGAGFSSFQWSFATGAGAYSVKAWLSSAGALWTADYVTAGSYVSATTYVIGPAIIASGDAGAGTASTLKLTNATVGDGSNDATLGKAPAAAGRSGWIKAYVGTTAVAIPYWAAT